jgi:hypothetical protein
LICLRSAYKSASFVKVHEFELAMNTRQRHFGHFPRNFGAVQSLHSTPLQSHPCRISPIWEPVRRLLCMHAVRCITPAVCDALQLHGPHACSCCQLPHQAHGFRLGVALNSAMRVCARVQIRSAQTHLRVGHLSSFRTSSWAGCVLDFWWFPLYELHVYSSMWSEAEALSEYCAVPE